MNARVVTRAALALAVLAALAVTTPNTRQMRVTSLGVTAHLGLTGSATDR